MSKRNIHKIYEYRWDWSASPFLRMLIALIVGIGLYSLINIRTPIIPIILVALLLGYYVLLKKGVNFRYRFLYGILIQTMTILFGYTLASTQDGTKDTTHFSNYIDNESIDIYGLVTEVKERKSRYEAVVSVRQVLHKDSLIKVTGMLNAYIPYKNIDATLAAGKHIALSADITEHPEPRNPEVFDYGHYLSKKHIYHQTKDVNQINIISDCESSQFWMSKHRERILQSLHQHIDDQSNYSIAASIILGYRDAVDYETKRAFAETGSIHILAVSGMHVGVVFIILGLIIGRINNHRAGYRYLKIILYLIGIWGFVLLAGTPPSALRAAWLFTLILITGLLPGKSNLYHRLGTAAFMMLIWNTNYIFDVGFQLSFTAITGIAAFGPIWEKLYTPGRATQYLWDGIGMTIGATLGTLPLTMYYFHYFPVTGLISSIAVIFLAGVILYLGVAFLLCFWLAFLIPGFAYGMALVGDLLNFVIGILQQIVHFFHNLPYGLISGISLSILAVLLLYALFISVRMLLNESKRKVFIYTAALSIFGLGFMNYLKRNQNINTNQIVIYHDYQNNAIELFEGASTVLISDEPVEDRYAGFLNQGLRINKQVDETQSILASSKVIGKRYAYDKGALKFGDQEVLVVDNISDLDGKESIHWDYIVLVDNAKVSIVELFDQLKFDHVVFGASNWQSNIDKWIDACNELEIDYVDIKNTKALMIDV